MLGAYGPAVRRSRFFFQVYDAVRTCGPASPGTTSTPEPARRQKLDPGPGSGWMPGWRRRSLTACVRSVSTAAGCARFLLQSLTPVESLLHPWTSAPMPSHRQLVRRCGTPSRSAPAAEVCGCVVASSARSSITLRMLARLSASRCTAWRWCGRQPVPRSRCRLYDLTEKPRPYGRQWELARPSCSPGSPRDVF